jgi:hypothetical protein
MDVAELDLWNLCVKTWRRRAFDRIASAVREAKAKLKGLSAEEEFKDRRPSGLQFF